VKSVGSPPKINFLPMVCKEVADAVDLLLQRAARDPKLLGRHLDRQALLAQHQAKTLLRRRQMRAGAQEILMHVVVGFVVACRAPGPRVVMQCSRQAWTRSSNS